MAALSMDDRLAPNDDVIVRELAGESVLLDMRNGVYFGLNGVGTRAWRVMTVGGTLRDVNEALAAEYDAPLPVIEREVLRFASELCEHGLCRLAETR